MEALGAGGRLLQIQVRQNRMEAQTRAEAGPMVRIYPDPKGTQNYPAKLITYKTYTLPAQ